MLNFNVRSISSKTIIDEAIKMGFSVDVLSEKYDIFYIKNKNKKVLFKNIDC